jgi:hypothetical protein
MQDNRTSDTKIAIGNALIGVGISGTIMQLLFFGGTLLNPTALGIIALVIYAALVIGGLLLRK